MSDRPYRILITGASGNVGAETIAALSAMPTDTPAAPAAGGGPGNRRLEIRAAVRDTGCYSALSQIVSPVRFDFTDDSTWDSALEAVDAVFLVRPPAISDIDAPLGPFIDRCAARGVKKIVFLSLIGVENMSYVPHHKVEAHIRSSGIPFVFLRPSFFMQNLSTTHRKEIAKEDEIFVPAGKGKTNFVDVRDIGEVAAKVLVEAGHEGEAYELTGSSSYDYFEIAEMISQAIGRKIRYAKPSAARFFLRSVRRGMPFGYALVMAGLYTASALGKAGKTTDGLEWLLGRKPRDFCSFANETRSAWKRP